MLFSKVMNFGSKLIPFMYLTLSSIAHSVPCGECFPVEGLSEELQKRADLIVLGALDTNGLYTLFGDLKPVSEGSLGSNGVETLLAGLDASELERLNVGLRCDTAKLYVGTHRYRSLSEEGELLGYQINNFLQSWREDLVADKVQAHSEVFRALGIDSIPNFSEFCLSQRSFIQGRSFSSRKHEAFGILFGFPMPAIKHFVQYVDLSFKRQWMEFPVYGSPFLLGNFVYSVESKTDVDREMLARSEQIFERYKSLRSIHIDSENRGAIQFLRSIYDDGRGDCSPKNFRAL